MITVPVKLGKRSYNIDIGKNAIKTLPQGLKKRFNAHQYVILTNTTIAKLYQKKIESLFKKTKLHWIIIPDGEKYKTLATIEKIYHQLLKIKADRKTPLIAFGGGVIGDMGGFAAATFLRGIPYIQIPTTLLSQVDSSVGGKTGVDLKYGKNLVGAFNQPQWVLIDTEFLKTLPKREFLCGLSEVIKYGLLWDVKFLNYIDKNSQTILKLRQKDLETIIKRSCEIKALIVKRDEKETSGLRALLNLGHTLGHAIETLSGFGKIHHGEAVSMGMMYAATISFMEGYLSENEAKRVESILTQCELPTQWPAFSKKQYAQTMSLDKKADNDKIQYVFMKRIGKAFLEKRDVSELVFLIL